MKLFRTYVVFAVAPLAARRCQATMSFRTTAPIVQRATVSYPTPALSTARKSPGGNPTNPISDVPEPVSKAFASDSNTGTDTRSARFGLFNDLGKIATGGGIRLVARTALAGVERLLRRAFARLSVGATALASQSR